MSPAGGPDLLETIVAATRRAVEVREAARPSGALAALQTRSPKGADFEAALRRGSRCRVIAECKRRSPSRGILRAVYEPGSHALAYERAGAVAISVLTEPTFFDGSLDHLARVRAAVAIPVLRKDFIVSEYQLLEAAAFGADAALLIVGALETGELRRLLGTAHALGLAALVEVHDAVELGHALDAGARIVGVNSRNLRTLQVDMDVLGEVAAALPAGVTAVAESGIRTPGDLRRWSAAGYHAFLVGERLIAQEDPGRALEELLAS